MEFERSDAAHKVILITGAATGIGHAAARRFFDAGYAVALCDVSGEALREGAGDMESRDASRILTRVADVRDKDALKDFSREVFERYGRLDAVFANAGVHRSNSLLSVDDAELDFMIGTNVYGTIYTLQAAVPYIIKTGGGAVVVNASEQCFIGKSNNFVYGLTKGALGQMVKSLSVELGSYGIRVNAVCPSTVRTPLAEAAMKRWSDRDGISEEAAWAEENALFFRNEAGRPEEVADMVYFLAEQGTFCTGGAYLLDGGLTAR